MKKVLGRGLEALIPEIRENEKELGKSLFLCGIEEIKSNPNQPRKKFDDSSLSRLASSLKEKGFIQPLVVKNAAGGGYELIVGERRWRAAQKAGFSRVPVIIKNISNDKSLELSLIENIEREDLNPIDEAEAYKNILNSSGLTQEELSLKLRKDRSTISNYLRLLKLSEPIRVYLKNCDISVGHGVALLGTDDLRLQLDLCKRIISDNISVRQVELIIKQKREGREKKKLKNNKNNFYNPIIYSLEEVLGTKVNISSNKKGGKIEISFYSEDDLSRIIDIIKD